MLGARAVLLQCDDLGVDKQLLEKLYSYTMRKAAGIRVWGEMVGGLRLSFDSHNNM